MAGIRRLIVTGLGTGLLPAAPGTWASAAVCAIYLLVALGSGGRQVCLTGTMALLAAAAGVGCAALGPYAEATFCQKGRKDPRECTLDEWAGQALTLCLLPLGISPRGWVLAAATAFVLFRLFDILKPPPARALEKLPAGWGVLADDLMAGIYANLAAQVLLRWVLPGT